MSDHQHDVAELVDRLTSAVAVCRDHETRLRELRQIYGSCHSLVTAKRADYSRSLGVVVVAMRALMDLDGERCRFCKSPPGGGEGRVGS